MFQTTWFHPQGDSCICSMVCFACNGVSSLVDRRVCSRPSYPPDCTHHCMQNIPYCIYNCFTEDEPMRFETCRKQQKLNINIENCAFHWFVLYKCITMHGEKQYLIPTCCTVFVNYCYHMFQPQFLPFIRELKHVGAIINK